MPRAQSSHHPTYGLFALACVATTLLACRPAQQNGGTKLGSDVSTVATYSFAEFIRRAGLGAGHCLHGKIGEAIETRSGNVPRSFLRLDDVRSLCGRQDVPSSVWVDFAGSPICSSGTSGCQAPGTEVVVFLSGAEGSNSCEETSPCKSPLAVTTRTIFDDADGKVTNDLRDPFLAIEDVVTVPKDTLFRLISRLSSGTEGETCDDECVNPLECYYGSGCFHVRRLPESSSERSSSASGGSSGPSESGRDAGR